MMLATLSALCINAQAEDLLKDFKASGFFDTYYGYSFNKPGTNAILTDRQFDVKHNNLSIAALQLNLVKATTAEDPWGLTLNFAAGKNSDIQNAFEPGGKDTYKYLQQAYVTYAAKNGITYDLGKFTSWVGLEGPIALNNDLYSISFLFTMLQPTYHFGLRASKPFGKATGTVYLVNGWNEVEDSNAGKSFGATLALPLGEKTNLIFNYYGGNEGASGTNGIGIGGNTSIHMIDFIATHQLTPKLKLSLNADYASAKGVSTGDPGGKFYGFAAYAKNQFSDKIAGTLRYEVVNDPDNLRATNNARLTSFTGSLEVASSKSSVLRVDLRFDKSNRSTFENENGGFKDSRTTLTIAHIFKF